MVPSPNDDDDAGEATATEAPFEWTAHYDDAGELYYYNDKSGESSWEVPAGGFNPADEPIAATAKKVWTKHKDDDGQEYFYNEASEETQWDRPEDYVSDADEGDEAEGDEAAKEEIPKEEAVIKEEVIKEEAASSEWGEEGASSDAAVKEEEEPPVSPAVKEEAAEKTSAWIKHKDDDGQEYYFNEKTEETQWDQPDDYVEVKKEETASVKKEEAASVKEEETAAVKEEETAAVKEEETAEESGDQTMEDATKMGDTKAKNWTEHTDDEGRTYYYDEASGETQWDKPSDFVKSAADDVKETTKPKWEKHTNDDGQVYYYNEESEETQWDKPDDFVDDADDDEEDDSSPVHASSPIDTGSPAGTPEHSGPPPDDDDDEPAATKSAAASPWTKHTDDEGREYYYNEGSGETQWDKPADFVEEAAAAATPAAATTATAAAAGKWTKHTDEEGREYYYNETSGETQWDAPADFTAAATIDGEEKKEESTAMETDATVATKAAEPIEDDTPMEPEPEPEPEIDPAVKRLQDAENALNLPDAIMEPGCLENVGELVSSLGREGGAKAFGSLVDSFHGQTAMCGLLGLWLADLKAASDEVDEPVKAANHVRDSAEDVINKIAKEKFTKAGGDNIFQLKKSEAVFLEEMMDSSLWRKLLIDLSATHRDSTLLSYCLSSISKRGHHREIAKRINQSDHFPVYTAMLASEFTVVGNGGEAMGMHELLDDLRRTCTSTSYTYLYAIEVLRYLVHTAEERASRDPSLNQAIRKWTRLKEELEGAMVDPSVSSKTAGSSSLYRKRRRDVALTVSELHQRQRRRIRPGGVDENGNLHDEQKDALELALSKLLLRHAEGKKFDDQMLDQLLQGNNPKEVGRLMNAHPLSIKALIGHLFLPGSSRVSSITTGSKCAQLIAMAVLAAESATKTERGFEDPAARQAKSDKIKESILTGSRMCELVENMVSFAVTTEMEIKKGSNPSAGVKLSVLANNSAPVAQGVVMWAKELISAHEFVSSASYPTLGPNILSLLRIISTRHPFTRSAVLEVALAFLSHSNRELSYQKMNEIREQALRMLLCLLVQGEVCSVLGQITMRLTKSGSFDLDASLVRYFVGGMLDVVAPPCSPLMVTAMGKLLLTTKCIEALQSTYFVEKKKKLQTLLGMIKHSLPPSKGKAKEVSIILDALVKTYASAK